ncbi:MAG: hypothetical protein UT28_C0001G0516 [Berkelbacteria bacterium GW2011_GWE1_39_12]|uniref:Uncharacterized protein n=1 Tax=Berkelbacteria bacterium GW2011_GWE1_39_12 TaxID=1618337 RepID=A0A0G4B2Z7_9BACT|nr:MAG: hypothetical protein UT28_C0001G0516 [Berkelbacteria bacterium GW2011_GWE1_39_12]
MKTISIQEKQNRIFRKMSAEKKLKMMDSFFLIVRMLIPYLIYCQCLGKNKRLQS